MNRNRSRMLRLGTVGLLLAILGCRNAETKEDVALALSYGRLASIPTNASAFQIMHDADYFGAYFIRFATPAATLERWLQDSKGLRGVMSTAMGPTCTWTPFKGDASQQRSRLDVPYVAGRKTTPTWWHPPLTNSGRFFQIPGKQGCGAGGLVVVDEQSDTVYVYTRW